MEKQDVKETISDSQFLKLLEDAKNRDPEALVQLVELFRKDIKRLSKFIYLPDEEAESEIILEFLEFVLAKERE
ncbi:helix-turn-helix domain-containing protein [Paenibacillus sp. ACRSA]|uniref:helix-turn-helix domain-containing protein n=1 Tax=Paenibacillus sp. ACRSA TaxID=2918211 RepID=UPI001EF544EA|nr:helix-turn-helix domain-containing protein [Paenibacillus sp. ACRSA]MCG7379344.1 helix-turn-helix domain-containing protein [Paenibacillus sp. ACRSA]